MKTPEITDWVTSVEQAHELVRATSGANSQADAAGMLGEALAALEALHGRMLRAEVRAVLAKAAGSEG